MFKLTKRQLLTLSFAGFINIALSGPSCAKPPAKPPRPVKPKPQPRPPKTPPVKPTPKVKRQSRREIDRGKAIANPSVKRPQSVSHPYRHRPMSNRQMAAHAKQRLAMAHAKKKQGKALSRSEKNILKNGATYSSFNSRRTMNHSVGYAHKHYHKQLSALKPGQRLEVSVPYPKSIGRVYNSRTGQYRESKSSKVVFIQGERGLYVKTIIAQ